MIRELERDLPPIAVLGDIPIDGRDELRFSRTHPVLWGWLMTRYEAVPREPFWALYRLYRLRVADGKGFPLSPGRPRMVAPWTRSSSSRD
jgi:hypothetical protein